MPTFLKENKYIWPIIIGIFVLAVLIVSISIAAYFLYILPQQATEKLSFEKLKYEDEQAVLKAEKQAIIDKETEEKAAEFNKQLDLELCLFDAQTAYKNAWESYCAIWKAEVKDTYEDCKKRWTNIGWTLQEAKDWCWTNTPDYNENELTGSCLLPTKYADAVEKNHENRKDECYLRHTS